MHAELAKRGRHCVHGAGTPQIMPTFCFYCGMVGHAKKSCERKMSVAKENMISEGQYGEW